MGFLPMFYDFVVVWGFSCASFGPVASVRTSVTDVAALRMRSPVFVATPFILFFTAPKTDFVPAEIIDPRSLDASAIANFLIKLLSRVTRALQYCLVIMPTRSVRKALAVPETIELVTIEVTIWNPGIAPTSDPDVLVRMRATCSPISMSSNPLATKAVDITFAYNWAISLNAGL